MHLFQSSEREREIVRASDDEHGDPDASKCFSRVMVGLRPRFDDDVATERLVYLSEQRLAEQPQDAGHDPSSDAREGGVGTQGHRLAVPALTDQLGVARVDALGLVADDVGGHHDHEAVEEFAVIRREVLGDQAAVRDTQHEIHVSAELVANQFGVVVGHVLVE